MSTTPRNPPQLSLSEAFNRAHAEKNRLRSVSSEEFSLHSPSLRGTSPYGHRQNSSKHTLNSLTPSVESSKHTIHRTISNVTTQSAFSVTSVPAPSRQRDKSSMDTLRQSQSTGNLRSKRGRGLSRKMLNKDLPPLPPLADDQHAELYQSQRVPERPTVSQISFFVQAFESNVSTAALHSAFFHLFFQS